MILQNSDVFAQLLNAKKLEEEVVAEYGDMRGEWFPVAAAAASHQGKGERRMTQWVKEKQDLVLLASYRLVACL